jgi:hypothetical protein
VQGGYSKKVLFEWFRFACDTSLCGDSYLGEDYAGPGVVCEADILLSLSWIYAVTACTCTLRILNRSRCLYNRPMSLLRNCQQALTKCAHARVAITQIRPYTESSVIPSGEDKSKALSRLPQEVVTADVVSGAPGVSAVSFGQPHAYHVYPQRSSVIGLYAYTNPPEILCRVELPRPITGALTGRSCKELDGGRTP